LLILVCNNPAFF